MPKEARFTVADVVQVGDTSFSVAEVRKALLRLGYLSAEDCASAAKSNPDAPNPTAATPAAAAPTPATPATTTHATTTHATTTHSDGNCCGSDAGNQTAVSATASTEPASAGPASTELASTGPANEADTGVSAYFTAKDTLFDEGLVEPLRAFQQSRGIMATGTITEQTLRMLREASFTLGSRVLSYQPNNQLAGDDVVQLQEQLHELGFYSSRLDGTFGPDTHEAVRSYQLNYGLNVDGIVGPNTVKALDYLGLRITGGSAGNIREREQVRQAGPRLAGKRIVLDPAGGGSDTGLSVPGPFGMISEEEIMWDIANRVEGRLVAAGCETIISRPRRDNPPHEQRADIANAFGADLMISLTADRYPNEKANGVATFYYGSEQGYSSLTGKALSSYIQREIAARTDLTNCGHHARTWDILRLTSMPTIEVVLGYLTNPADAAVLADPTSRDAIAEGIVVAIKRLYLMDDDDLATGTYSFSELLKGEK